MIKTLVKKVLEPIGRKGQQVTLSNLSVIALSLGFAILVISALATGVQSFQDTQTANSFAANISGTGLTALSNVTTQLPVVGTMIGVVLIIGVIGSIFISRRN